MFKRMLVAYDASLESGRALLTSIHLAKSLRRLEGSLVQQKLAPYDGYIDAEVPGGTVQLHKQASEYNRQLHADALEAARQEGITLMTELVEGDEVEAVAECVQRTQSDRLVVGIYRHSLLLSRLWNHTAHDLAQEVDSSLLDVH